MCVCPKAQTAFGAKVSGGEFERFPAGGSGDNGVGLNSCTAP